MIGPLRAARAFCGPRQKTALRCRAEPPNECAVASKSDMMQISKATLSTRIFFVGTEALWDFAYCGTPLQLTEAAFQRFTSGCQGAGRSASDSVTP